MADRALPTKEEIVRIANAEPETRTLAEANTMIDYLMHHLGVQGGRLLEMRQDMELVKGIMLGAVEKQRGAKKLVGFEKPPLIKVN